MNKVLLLFFILFSILFISHSLDLTVVWWNTMNFFDTTDDLYKEDTILTQEQYDTKLKSISDKISIFKADIVGLGEIENIYVLRDIANKTNYPYFYLEEGNDPRGIDVALMSKYPIIYKTNKDYPTPYQENKNYKFSRDCPVGLLDINGKKLYILITHLKAMMWNDPKSEKKRVGQTFAILDIISEIYESEKTAPYIFLMGDFNSHRYSEPMNILQKSGLIIINYFYKKNNVFTTKFKGKKEDIDYMIFNNTLFYKSKINKFKVFNEKEFDGISDHYPILINFTF